LPAENGLFNVLSFSGIYEKFSSYKQWQAVAGKLVWLACLVSLFG
jgi:hypothetical protein